MGLATRLYHWRWLSAGGWCGSFSGVPRLALIYRAVRVGTSVSLGIGKTLQDIIGQAVDHVRMVVAFSAVITGEVGTSVYMPLGLDGDVLWVEGKLVGGIFYCPSNGFP